MGKNNERKVTNEELNNLNTTNNDQISSTDAAGFRIDSTGQVTEPTGGEQFVVHSPESTVVPNTSPEVNQEDYNGDELVNRINQTSDNITLNTTETNLEGTVEHDEEFNKLVEDTMRGVYGSGRERMLALGKQYVEVQQEITRRIRSSK